MQQKSGVLFLGFFTLLFLWAQASPVPGADAGSSSVSRPKAEFKRHADGTFTSDVASYLERQTVKAFIKFLQEESENKKEILQRVTDWMERSLKRGELAPIEFVNILDNTQ
uniref:Mengal gland glucagon-like peptide isoform 3 mgGLP3 n=1 Tax=Desmognathus ocoee TaxID=179530 RepID=A0A0H4A7I9_9SALA|nr:mengal gland glucagon-like peptide isoform 3 mgGLP3 [Desmognathus ocoee]